MELPDYRLRGANEPPPDEPVGGELSGDDYDHNLAETTRALTELDEETVKTADAEEVTATKDVPVGADGAFLFDSAASNVVKKTTFDGVRTLPPGTGLGTSGTVNLDMAASVGVPQNITLTGNITFTTSNRAAGRSKTLRLDAGGSTRTITWPAWVAYGAALPTSLASGKVLIVTLFCNSTTDASIDAASALSA